MQPEVLYKYLSPERIDVLESLRIRFTQVSALNDPFESLPGATLENPEWYKTYFERRRASAAQRLGLSSPPEQAERRRGEQFAHFLKCYTDREWLAELSATVQRMADTVDGCLSLSANCTNILMWSHYAANHRGFVLGFNTDHEFFGPSVSAVKYSASIPKINPFEAKHSADIFYTKSNDWHYEQEYRKFLPFIEAERLPNGNYFLPYEESPGEHPSNKKINLVPFPKESIHCVILGWKSLPELRESVVGTLGKHGLKVPVLRALPSLTEYKMEVQP